MSLFDGAVFAKIVKVTKVDGLLLLCLSSKEKLINLLFKKIYIFHCVFAVCICVRVCVDMYI